MRTRLALAIVFAAPALAGLTLAPPPLARTQSVQVEERGFDALTRIPSATLVRAYQARIARIDKAGPALNSIIALDPSALAQATRLDAQPRTQPRGALHGLPILIKDNIDTAGVPTTAGSLALAGNVPARDAPLVARLRAAGAVILGKTNLSEWANIRSTRSSSGWSAVGGLTRNPYALNRNACGSSSGSGAAIAASLAAAAIGTETDGSITCPSAINGLVGLKPTVGLVSRTGVVPISHSQDTPGPMARSVRDAAILLGAIAGTDRADPATAQTDAHRTDYTARLRPDALRGVRIGVLRFAVGTDPHVAAVFEAALADLRGQGAELIDIKEFKELDDLGKAELTVLLTELKADMPAYLATTRTPYRTLADLIAFNTADAAREMRWFDQELFVQAQATRGLTDPAYIKARADSLRAAGADGIERMLRETRTRALVAPTNGPAWVTDLVMGDHTGDGGAGNLAAIAGTPHLTVPMGQVEGLPVGLSFMGPAWSEADLLALGYAYEQATHRRRPPTYAAHLPR